MKKIVVASIHKKWLDLIQSGEKRIEVRKSIPSNIELPFDLYFVETNSGGKVNIKCEVKDVFGLTLCHILKTCLAIDQLVEYSQGKEIYGWELSNVKEVDLHINDFYKPMIDFDGTHFWEEPQEKMKITKAPQSWCYAYIKEEE